MNKIYKLKFSRKTNELVAVAEIATNAVASTATSSADADLTRWRNATEPNYTTGSSLASSLVQYGLLAGSALTLALGTVVPAWANNGLVDPTVVAGTATIVNNGSVTTITNSPNTIINWQQFNIGKNELVQFIQESSNSAVLNRVLGNSVSEILGTLKSNGKVFLINPNGILFGANAVVDTNSLVASTLNMSDADFQAGKYVFNQEKDRAIASVLNQGVIKVQNDGTLALVGGNVVNTGILEAKNGSVYLLAGQSIQIADMNNPLISFKVTAGNKAVNLGEIVAKNVTMLAHGVNHGKDPVGSAFTELYTSGSANSSRISATGEVELYAGSVSDQLQTNQQTNTQVTGERSGLVVVNGEINTTNATGTAGKVTVLGDTVYVGTDSRINASGGFGGKVNIGGDYQGQGTLKLAQQTTLVAGQEISVAGQGDAGTAIIWGDDLSVDGTLSATSQTGEGGFVETSGHTFGAGEGFKVFTNSSYGKNGTWLIDPHKVYIIAKNATKPSDVTNDSELTNSNNVYGDFNGDSQVRLIYNTTIETALQTTNIKVLARNYLDVLANIVSQNKTTELTLEAYNTNIVGTEQTKILIDVGTLTLNNGWWNGSTLQIKNSVINATTINVPVFKFNGDPQENANVKFSNSEFNVGTFYFDVNTRTVEIDKVVINATKSAYIAGGLITIANTTFGTEAVPITVNIGSNYQNQVTINNTTIWATDANFFGKNSGSGNLCITDSRLNVTRNVTATNIGGNFQVKNSNVTVGNNYTIKGSDPTKFRPGYGEFIVGADQTVKIGGNLIADVATNFYITGNVDVTGDVDVAVQGGTVRLLDGKLTAKSFKGVAALDRYNTTEFANNYSIVTSDGDITWCVTGDRLIKISNSNFTATGHNVTFNTSKGWVDAFNNVNVAASNFALVIPENGNKLVIQNSNIAVTENINITSGANNVWRANEVFQITGTNLTAGGSIVLKGNEAENNFSASNISGVNLDLSLKRNLQAIKSTIKGSGNVNVAVAGANEYPKIENTTIEGKELNISVEGGNLTVFGSNLTSTVGAAKLAAGNLTLNVSNVAANTALTVNFTKANLNASQLHSRFGELTLGNDTSTDLLVTKSCITSGLKDGDPNPGSAAALHDVNLTAHNVAITGSIFNASKNVLVNATANNVSISDSNFTASSAHCVTITGQKFVVFNNSNASAKGFDLTATTENATITTAVVKAATGDITVKAGKNLAVTDVVFSSSTVTAGTPAATTAAANINLYAANGEAVLNNTSAYSTGLFNVTAAQDVKLINGQKTSGKNSLITGQDFNLTSSGGALVINGYELAAGNNLTLAGKTNLEMTNTDATANKHFFVRGVENTTLVTSNLAARNGDLSIGVDKLVNFSATCSSLATGYSQAEIDRNTQVREQEKEQTGVVTTPELPAITTKGDVNVNATNIKFESSAIKSTQDLNLSSSAKTAFPAVSSVVTLTGTEVDVARSINITSAAVTITGGVMSTGEHPATAGQIPGCISIQATGGALSVKGGAQIFADNGPLQLTSTSDLEIDSSDVVGKSVTIQATCATSSVKVLNATVYASSEAVTITAPKDLVLGNGTNITATQKVDLTATDGSITATGSNITSGANYNVTLKGKKGIALDNTNISGTNVNTYAGNDPDASLSIANSSVTATNKLNLTATKDVSLTQGTIVKGGTEVEVKAQAGAVTATNSNITAADTATVQVAGHTGVTLENANVTGGKVDFYAGSAQDATLKVANSTITAHKTLNLTATKDLTLTNGTKVEGKEGVVLNAQNGELSAIGSNITASDTAAVTLKGKTGVSLDNTNVSGKDISAYAGDGTDASVKVANSALTAGNKVNLTATKNVELTRGSVVKGENEVVVKATTGLITAKESNVTGGVNSEITLSGNKGVALDNANVTGKNVTAYAGNAADAKLTVSNSTVTATNKLNLTATANVELDRGSIVKGDKVVEVKSQTGSITAKDSNITGGTDAEVTLVGNKGVALDNANVTGKNVTAFAGDDANAKLTVSNSTVTATNKLNLTATSNVELDRGSIVKGESVVEVKSQTGSIKAKDSNITGGTDAEVTLTGKTGVALDNANVTGKNVTAYAGNAADAKLTISNSTVTATNKLNLTATSNVELDRGSVVKGDKVVEVKSKDGAVLATNSNITGGTEAEVSLAGKTGITLNNSNVSGKNVTSVAGDANTQASITVTNSSVSASNTVVLNATKDITLTNGSKVHGEQGAEVTAQGGALTATGSNITASSTADVTLSAKTGISLANTNVSGQNVKVAAGDGTTEATISIANSSVTANGKLNVTATKDVTLTNGTKVKGETGVEVTAKNGSVTATESNVTGGDQATVTLSGKTGISLDNANVTGKNVTAFAGDDVNAVVKAANSTLTATNKLNLTATKDVTLTNGTKLEGTKEVELNAKTGSLSATGANVTGGDDATITLTGKQGITLTNTNISGKDVTAHAGDDQTPASITVANSTVTAGNKLNVTATQDVSLSKGTKVKGDAEVGVTAKGGTVTVTESNVTGGANSQVTLTGNKGVSLDNANVTGKDVTAYAGDSTDATLTVANSTLNASNKLNLTATKDVTLNNGTKLEGTNEVEITAKEGKVAATGTNVTGGENSEFSITAKTGITLDNTNITGKNVDTVAGDATHPASITVGNSSVTATGKLNVTATQNVELNRGSKLSGTNEVEITAQDGTVTAKDSNVTGGENSEVTLTGKKGVSLDNANVTGKDVTAYAGDDPTASLKVANSTVTAGNKLNLTGTQNVELTNGTNVSGVHGAELNAQQGQLTVVGSNVTSSGEDGKVELKAATGIKLDNANVSGNGGVVANATGGKLDVLNSSVTATKGAVDLKGESVTLGNGTEVTGSSVTVNATTGALVVTGANITATSETGKVDLVAKTDITLDNANVSGKGGVTANAEGNFVAKDTDVASEKGVTDIKGKEVTLGNGTTVSSTGVTVNATTGGLSVTGANITATSETGKIDLVAKGDITLDNANVSGKGGVTANAEGNFVAKDSDVASEKGVTDIKGKEVTLGNGTTVSGTGVTVNATTGGLSVTGANITATSETGKVDLAAKGDITLDNANVSGKGGVTANAEGNFVAKDSDVVSEKGVTDIKADTVTLGNGTTVLGTGVVVNATSGGLSVTGANVTATSDKGSVDLIATGDIKLDNANVSGKGGVTASADGNLEVKDSEVAAPNGAVDLTGQTVSLGNGTKVSGDSVAMNATAGELTLVGTNVTTDVGAVDLKATTDVKLDNTNVSGKTDVTLTATTGNVNVTGGEILADGKLNVTAGHDANLDHTFIFGKEAVNINATNDVNLKKAEVGAQGKATISAGNDVEITDGSAVFGRDGVNATAGNQLSLDKADIAATNGKVDLTGTKGTDVQDSKIKGGKGVMVDTPQGTTTIGNSTVNTTTGDAVVSGHDGITLTNGTKVESAKGNVVVTSDAGKVDITGTNLTAPAGKVDLTGKQGIELVNTNISGQQGVTMDGTDGELTVTGTDIQSAGGKVTATATGDVELSDVKVTGGTGVEVKSEVGNTALDQVTTTTTTGPIEVTGTKGTTVTDSSMNAQNGNVSVFTTQGETVVTGSQVSSDKGSVNVDGATGTKLDNTTATAQQHVNVTSPTGTVEVTGGKLDTTIGNVTVSGAQGVNVSNTTSNAGKDVIIQAPNGNVTVVDNKVTAGNTVQITTPNGSSVIQGNNFDSDGFLATAGEDLTLRDNFLLEGPVYLETINSTLTVQNNGGKGTSLTLKYPSPEQLVDDSNSWIFNERVIATTNYPTIDIELEAAINPQDFLNNEIYVDSSRMSKTTLINGDEVEVTESMSVDFGGEDQQKSAVLPEQNLPLPLGSCPAHAQAIAAKYGMSATDYASMTLEQLKRKYRISETDAQTMQSSCNINFDWNKMSINQFLKK